MICEGQTFLFTFPRTDQGGGKLRPALVLRKLPGKFDDWLICMISSQLHQHVPEIDELIRPEDSDFSLSGLKVPSVIRASRLALVDAKILLGALGHIDPHRLLRIKQKLSEWITGA
ncbi:type II toxin-antitoxin system PemK/MazF family toxin [Desulfohalobiaceae bacterium Ax17]|uniref:type II toxin-antitoxin system PemK/MazF family toxin n=1 Tax=Desulfovulcanus ferrireducens TaxID=2831190 RepID=UPI00336AD503|nr:type II toxin-antitoxin system PemK/MazF family toxin [Desulfovulcanus ferrireducens]